MPTASVLGSVDGLLAFPHLALGHAGHPRSEHLESPLMRARFFALNLARPTLVLGSAPIDVGPCESLFILPFAVSAGYLKEECVRTRRSAPVEATETPGCPTGDVASAA